MSQDSQKQAVAHAALELVLPHLTRQTILGIGTGSTAAFFIHALAEYKSQFTGAVSSSEASTEQLSEHNIPVFDLNAVASLPFYIDGTDEVNDHLHLIKGGGGALTREKIIAACADTYICIADETKVVDVLGRFPLPVEVIPMARSYVTREIIKMGGQPVHRANYVTDNGCDILDIHGLHIEHACELERALDGITGVVSNGLFANKPADVLLVGGAEGVNIYQAE